jgi:hypothetical protein
MDLADVKPTVMSWLVVGLMALTFIVLAKMLMQRYPVPGLASIVNAA